MGILGGFEGPAEGKMRESMAKDVAEIVNIGGTILRTSNKGTRARVSGQVSSHGKAAWHGSHGSPCERSYLEDQHNAARFSTFLRCTCCRHELRRIARRGIDYPRPRSLHYLLFYEFIP